MPKYSDNYGPEEHKRAARVSRIRKKLKAGKRLTQEERAFLDSYEAKKPNRTRPKAEEPAATEAPQVDTVAQKPESAQATEATPPAGDVMNTLPGMEPGAFVPPPIAVDAGATAPTSNTASAAAGASSGPAAAQASAPSAGSQTTSSAPRSGPAMTPQEAEAMGGPVADMVTQVVKELNAYNLAHGASGFDPNSGFWDMFRFSVKRLAVKYGAAIDEDTYDAIVIVGTGGFVGYNSFKVYAAEKKTKASAQTVSPVAEVKSEPGANGEAPRVVYSGSPDTIRRERLRGGFGEIDPKGYY